MILINMINCIALIAPLIDVNVLFNFLIDCLISINVACYLRDRNIRKLLDLWKMFTSICDDSRQAATINKPDFA